jgi:hypothetical protein
MKRGVKKENEWRERRKRERRDKMDGKSRYAGNGTNRTKENEAEKI